MSIMVNGHIVSTSDQMKDISLEDYINLDPNVQNDGTAYFVNEVSDADYKRLLHLTEVVGYGDSKRNELKEVTGYDNIIDAIVALHNRMGGVSFKGVSETGQLEFSYLESDKTPAKVDPIYIPDLITDYDKIDYFEKILGDEAKLNGIGFNTVITALISLYRRLGGISITYSDEKDTGELKMSYNDKEVMKEDSTE